MTTDEAITMLINDLAAIRPHVAALQARYDDHGDEEAFEQLVLLSSAAKDLDELIMGEIGMLELGADDETPGGDPETTNRIEMTKPAPGERSVSARINQTRITDDPIGDLIDDFKRDRESPGDFESLDRLGGYLRIRNACPETINAAGGVWKRYQRRLAEDKS